MTEFRTAPKAERPLARNLVALRRLRIGPIWPLDPEREVGMRGVPDPKCRLRRWVEYRAGRKRRRVIARASRRVNR